MRSPWMRRKGAGCLGGGTRKTAQGAAITWWKRRFPPRAHPARLPVVRRRSRGAPARRKRIASAGHPVPSPGGRKAAARQEQTRETKQAGPASVILSCQIRASQAQNYEQTTNRKWPNGGRMKKSRLVAEAAIAGGPDQCGWTVSGPVSRRGLPEGFPPGSLGGLSRSGSGAVGFPASYAQSLAAVMWPAKPGFADRSRHPLHA